MVIPGGIEVTRYYNTIFFEDCVSEVMAQGKSKDSAWAICQSSVMGKSIPDSSDNPSMGGKEVVSIIKADTSLAGGVPNSLLSTQDLEGKKKTLKSISIIKKGKVTHTFKTESEYLKHIGKSFKEYWKGGGVHFNPSPMSQNAMYIQPSYSGNSVMNTSFDNGVLTIRVPQIGYTTQYQFDVDDMPQGGQMVSFA